MKRFYFARALRASGRLLLFIGAMLGIGLTAINIYLYFYRLNNPGVSLEPIQIFPQETTGAVYDSPSPTAAAVTATISIIAAIGLAALVAAIYNGHMRSIIARIARLFKAQIFTVEVVSTGIAWTITTLLLFFFIPSAAIVATFAFIINELLFIFAWGVYGQPNYII